ncbi:MAG: TolC family protein [Gammaproteobacteria bacterium]|nr:TolC family protein [Gammaproteobacteria bacterium]MCW8986700.1 TolC family protein [Gammaproteobacteria bacterium]
MALSARFIQVTISFALLINFSVHAEQNISIERAVQIALEHDSLTHVFKFRRDAYKNLSIAEDTLPDPKIKLGVVNAPTDTFALDQEPMTQVQLGIQQMFPRGNSLEIKSQRALSMSVAEDAKTENQRRKVTREVRETWLELYYWLHAESVVKENRKLFTELVSVTKQQYAAGRQKQQDVIRSELELGMLDDREMKIQTQIETTQAKLAKYLGTDYSDIKIGINLPTYDIKNKSTSWLDSHPMLRMEQAMVAVGEKNVDLAKQSYKPSWSVDLTYGQRNGKNPNGSERADFASAMVMFDLPLFTADRQDKQVAASKFRLNGALNSREEQKRNLIKMWQAALAKEKRLLQRVKQYDVLLLPKSDENTKSALYAYQSGRSGFTALMRAQITELETQLRAIRLTVEHKKTQALLLYLVGENS